MFCPAENYFFTVSKEMHANESVFVYFGIFALIFLKYLIIHRIIILVEVYSCINPGNITEKVFLQPFFVALRSKIFTLSHSLKR